MEYLYGTSYIVSGYTHTQAHTNATWCVYEPLMGKAYVLRYLLGHP